MLLRLRFVTLIFLLLFLCLFSLGYLFCSSFTAHCCLAFSPFWCVLRAWMGAPIKTYANLRVSPVSHTTEILIEIYYTFNSRKCIWKYHLRNSGHFVPWGQLTQWGKVTLYHHWFMVHWLMDCRMFKDNPLTEPMLVYCQLTYCGQNCRHFPDDIFKCIFWIKIYEFRLRFHWSLFLRFADQATSPYLTQWWLVYWRIHASLGFIDLNTKENISMDFYLKFKRFHMKNVDCGNGTQFISPSVCLIAIIWHILCSLGNT